MGKIKKPMKGEEKVEKNEMHNWRETGSFILVRLD